MVVFIYYDPLNERDNGRDVTLSVKNKYVRPGPFK